MAADRICGGGRIHILPCAGDGTAVGHDRGHPVVNDARYGKKTLDDSGQYLHAYYLSFVHPTSNERMEFTTEMPSYMKEYIQAKGGKFYG